jgi:hypothetical protein
VAQQESRNRRQAEGGDRTVETIGDGDAHAGNETRQRAALERPAKAQQPHRADRRRQQEAEQQPLEEENRHGRWSVT